MAADPWAGFERDLALITAEADPEVIRREFAAFAKTSVADLVSSGQASPLYDRYVNGRPNLPEEAVELPGLIVYEFVNWPLVINAALEELQNRAPRNWSRFQSSFIVIAGQRVVTDFKQIPAGAEVIITNAQPFVRKVEAGIMRVPQNHVFDGARRVMSSRFTGSFSFVTRWLNIASGVHPLIPYILKGDYNHRRNAAIAAGQPRQRRRKDRDAGMPITYPAIIINMH